MEGIGEGTVEQPEAKVRHSAHSISRYMLHHLFSHCPISDLYLPLDRHGVGGEFRVLPGDLGGLLSGPLEMLNQSRSMPFLAALTAMITTANIQTNA